MKSIQIYQVDAFTHVPITGNPAAVCVLTDPVTEETMQKTAMKNHLPETAFITRGKDEWLIRWFTPMQEVDLCGHATLNGDRNESQAQHRCILKASSLSDLD